MPEKRQRLRRARITPENLLLWRQEFRLAASIWEGSAQVADSAIPYSEDDEEAVPVDADGRFDYEARKETFALEALAAAKRLKAGSEKGSTIRDIAAHIEQFAYEDLTLQSISDKFHLFTQIAEMAGFQDEKYFSKVFKKWTDTAPSEYRKRLYDMDSK